MQEKRKIEKVLESFQGYIQDKTEIEFFWSEKQGCYFVIGWNLDGLDGNIKLFKTGEEVCTFLLYEIYVDQYMKYGIQKLPGLNKMTEEQMKETRDIMGEYLEKLPEYKSFIEEYISSMVINNNAV